MRRELTRLSAAEYFADPCEQPSLSASIAHEIDHRSALHAYSRHPRLGGVPRADTKSFDMGTLAHALLLGEGKDVAVVDADDWRTKAAQILRNEARAAGKVPILCAEYEAAEKAADALRARFADFGIVLDGDSEVTAFWGEDSDDAGPVQCRGMLDHIKLPVIYDLKSCRSAHPSACQKHSDSYGYAIQRAAYVSAIENNRPELAGRVDFIFVFFELEPPFAVTPVRLSGEFRELGERRWQRAVNVWGRCLRDNHWPGYVDKITDIHPPPWALLDDMNKQVSEPDWAAE